ncbi:MAG: hypothetical protein U0793_19930 [Gemmataceae bacterium]
MYAILLAFVVCAAGIAMFALWQRRRALHGPMVFLEDEEGPEEREETPEKSEDARFVVDITAEAISCRCPDGRQQWTRWEELRRVELVITDTGPFLTDVFWVLHGADSVCVIPQGATGERALLRRLQELPGFRNEAVIGAMSCVRNRAFLCWEAVHVDS